MKYLNTLLIVILTSTFAFSQADSVLLHFNNLTLGDLDGQDGWRTVNQTTGPSDLIVGLAAGNVVTPDGTNGIFYNSGGAGFGRTATKKSFNNFELDLSDGGIIELEAEIHRNWWGEFIGIGYDANGNGIIAPGLPTEPNEGGVMISMAGVNFPAGNGLTIPSGQKTTYDVDNAGWIKYRLFIDLDANGGQGQAALFYKLPPFDGDWLAASDIQGINLGLTPGSGDMNDPAMWDGVFFHAQGGTAFFDNIVLRRPGASGPKAQFIDFQAVGKQLSTADPIELVASADSGLPVEFELISGPATLNGNIVTLTGAEGMIEIRATQEGDGVNWAAATPISRTFQVIDPALYEPSLTLRRPVDGQPVIMTELSAFMMVASTYIEHDDLLSIEEVSFTVDGETFDGKDWGTGYFTTYWTPPDYGTYTATITSTSDKGVSTSKSATFEVVNASGEQSIKLIDGVHMATVGGTLDTNVVLPIFVGNYSKIDMLFNYDCPQGGCDPWDRIAQHELQSPSGEWIGFARYITPYGVACDHLVDLTRYSGVLQGNTRFLLRSVTASVITMTLTYKVGTPDYKYSWVQNVWNGTYSFGDFANLQPVPQKIVSPHDNAEAAQLTLITSGHGWGQNNSLNAAEFYEATHHIKVNDGVEFFQFLWTDCNPNPDGCQPQNGTWFHDRSGWCPGSFVEYFDYNMSNFLVLPSWKMDYEFDPDYIDYCHINHPDCVSGSTCENCSDGFNPHYPVDAHLITYSNLPLEDNLTNTTDVSPGIDFSVIPNPNEGRFTISTENDLGAKSYLILNALGQTIQKGIWNSFEYKDLEIDLENESRGVYWFGLKTGDGFVWEKIVVQ